MGHEVHVITLGKLEDPAEGVLNGVQLHRVPLRNLYWPFPFARVGLAAKVAWHARDANNAAMARSVGLLLDRLRPEVVNTHNLAGFSAAVWEAAAGRALPIVHTLHDHYLLCPYSTMFRSARSCEQPCLRCRIATAPRRRQARHVRAVIGVSRYILERHLDGGLFCKAAASVVYNGSRMPERVPELRTPGEPLRVGFLGTLAPNKGLDRLIDSFMPLLPGGAVLRIGGTGDTGYEASLRRRTETRSDILWMGRVRAEDFLAGLDVLVVPSVCKEAMGLVAVEAMGLGLPVVATRCGGLVELVRDDCGWIYDPEDRARLTAILGEIISRRDVLAPMKAAARKSASRFSVATMLSGYLAAYAITLERGARGVRGRPDGE
jgi:glycosyltransferase involved in cell wall biosynthesis